MAQPVDYRDTLITYLNSKTVEEAAKNLNISTAVLKSRIATLREHGVKVPNKIRDQWSELAVAQLNSIVRKYTETK